MRLLIITLIFTGSLLAVDFSTRYDVDVGMFGKVGYADVTLSEDKDSYEMKVVATTTGTASTLTGKRIETYISKGKIISGQYQPDTFVRMKKTTRKERIQTYHFDHNKQEVILDQNEVKWITQTRFDTKKFKLVKEDVKDISNSRSVLSTYNNNDVLSAYLNTKQNCNTHQKEYNLLAVGAHNDKKDITVSFLEGLKKVEVASSFSKDIGNIYNLHVQPIDKDDTTVDVLLAFDNDGHMKEALLGNVFWIGEIKATRVYHQVARN